MWAVHPYVDQCIDLLYDLNLGWAWIVNDDLNRPGRVTGSVFTEGSATRPNDSSVNAVMLLNVCNQFFGRLAVALLHPCQPIDDDWVGGEEALPMFSEVASVVLAYLALCKQGRHQFLGIE